MVLLLHDMGTSDHAIDEDACDALLTALQAVHAELRDTWERARAEARQSDYWCHCATGWPRSHGAVQPSRITSSRKLSWETRLRN